MVLGMILVWVLFIAEPLPLGISAQTSVLQCAGLYAGIDHPTLFSHSSGKSGHTHCLWGVGGHRQSLFASVFHEVVIRFALVLLRTGQPIFAGSSFLATSEFGSVHLFAGYHD